MKKPTNDLVPLFNPLSQTFSYEWFNENNEKQILTMEPISISYFTESQADFMVKHLTDEVINRRKLNGINHRAEIEEIIRQIKVKT